MQLWFDVVREYDTTGRACEERVDLLWFDVVREYDTTL